MIVGCLKIKVSKNELLIYFKNSLLLMTLCSLKIVKTFKTNCHQQHWLKFEESHGTLDKEWKKKHSYDILGAGMLWKPKEAQILTNAECFDKVLYHVNLRILKCKMTNVITLKKTPIVANNSYM